MLFDRLRSATALAHAVPGVTVALVTAPGDHLVVAHRPDADLTPCMLRGLVAEAMRRPATDLLPRVVDVDVVCGLEDLGAGVYRRVERGVEQRWLATTLPHAQVAALLAECPVDDPGDALRARVVVDTELDTTLVGFTADHELYAWRLDELALWAQGALLVEELTTACHDEAPR